MFSAADDFRDNHGLPNWDAIVLIYARQFYVYYVYY